MIDALRSQGHEVIVVAPPGASDQEFGSDAGFVTKLKQALPKWAYELLEVSYSFLAYRQLAKAVKQHKPDCLYERYNLFMLAGIWIKKRLRLPMLLEVNAPIFEERSKYDGLALQRFARWAQGYVWRNADFTLPVTGVLGDIVASYGVARERIAVIPNGINQDRFSRAPSLTQAKQDLGLQDKLVLGFTGFVREWHGMDKVIDLIAGDPADSARHLLIVGDGPIRQSLEDQARRLAIADRVTFTGIVSRDEVARYVAAFDIALQPAVVSYASPLKLFEYLALGKAVVAPDQQNIKEILEDNGNALLFDPNDSHGLAKAIGVLSEDINLRKKIGDNAKKSIDEKQLTWTANASRAAQLFQRLETHA
ncbi:Glycosyltransferase involved in cell wall bisynthesis [Noviherbaspirillum humi]|uniref:Glycosyltransferase involved in cell wall bisynthesis n=2 Tax=Noviherbaspirillum humi TaxID=1688639 RepID=A0A239HJP3_9BURK|nr:Glycosyltransferase involved in cell wall bisynthesis [Noviherbaspirillum humi]